MPYNKTIVLNEDEDMFLQEELQKFRAMVYPCQENTNEMAEEILAKLETAVESDVT